MTEPKQTHPPTTLPGSWQLVRPSIDLIRHNLDTMLWLVIIPGVMSVLGNLLYNTLSRKYLAALPASPTFHDLAITFRQIEHDLATTSLGQISVTLLTVSFIWQVLVYPATIILLVRAAQGKDADVVTCLRRGFSMFWRIYGVTFLVMITVFAGLILFIVPGLIALRRYLFAPFYLVDQDVSIGDSMRKSAHEGLNYKSYVWGTVGVFVTFVIASLILTSVPYVGFIFGLIASYVYYFGFVLRYASIRDAASDISAPPKK